MWLATKVNVDRKVLVRAALECAKSVSHLSKDNRVAECIDATERWLRDEILGAELRKFADASAAAYAYAAYAAAADGDNWTDDCGRPLVSNEFASANIVLIHGPRNGDIVG